MWTSDNRVLRVYVYSGMLISEIHSTILVQTCGYTPDLQFWLKWISSGAGKDIIKSYPIPGLVIYMHVLTDCISCILCMRYESSLVTSAQLMWHTDMQWVPTWHHPKLAATALERIVFTYAWWNIPCSPIDGAHQYTKYWIIMLHKYIQGVLLLRCLAGNMALPPAQPEQTKPSIYAWTGLDNICIQISISDHRGGMGCGHTRLELLS